MNIQPRSLSRKSLFRVFSIVILALAEACLIQAGDITTLPSADSNKNIVVKKGGDVTFTATPIKGGDVTTTMDISPEISPGVPSKSGSGCAITVNFPDGTEGRSYICTFNVTHKNTEASPEYCSTDKQFVFFVFVPNIEGVGNGDDIWFFEDGQGDATHPVQKGVSVTCVPSDKTMLWNLKGESDVVNFSNNQETITGTDANRVIHTVGYSHHEENLFIELQIDGNVVASTEESKFTARAPLKITELAQTPEPYSNGWKREYKYLIKDKFDAIGLPGVKFCEVFQYPDDWPKNNSAYNWPAPSYYEEGGENGGDLDGDSYGLDVFRYYTESGEVPTSVHPYDTDYTVPVMHNTQWYKVGGFTTNPGYSATGFEVFRDNIQFCRGTAYR